ncbi:prostatic acid phosphatase isoform X1 [Lingula anatina]|uniref:acid phosphatase n=2 Tax=Lingula anatina TaxID=7574 RepID=A0A2R2MRV0_LINAN|nr:prostatic acid phosphatase isoform X1 [Lingula anatina]|eukprot:XP_023932984.1 prostatic acid phosphatase isoform X1 [Lingula anatina]
MGMGRTEDLVFTAVLLMSCMSRTCEEAPQTLVQVNLHFRHGDRTPFIPYPSSQWQEDAWPEGLGQLTRLGMRQQCELGQFIRRRYDGFLDKSYIRTEVSVRSTDTDRTVMSAQTNLACLFPLSGQQQWHETLPWQPVPVHIPLLQTFPNSTFEGCPRYELLFNELMQSELVQEKEKLYQGFVSKVSSLAGYTDAKLENVWNMEDPLFCEWCQNKTAPSWLHSVWPDTNKTMWTMIRELTHYYWRWQRGTDELRKLWGGGGKILSEFVGNMQKKISAGPSNTSVPKMFMYSGHDSTVAPLLAAMNVFNNVSPPYAACVIVELHQDPVTGGHWVQVLYRNLSRDPGSMNTHPEPYELSIPGCKFKCPFDRFLSLNADVLMTGAEWTEACSITTAKERALKIVAIVAIPALVIVLVICALIFYSRRKRAKQDFTSQPLLSLEDEDEEEL